MKGKLIQDKYILLQTLGRDAFSETFLAQDKDGLLQRRYIIKKFRPILGHPQAAEIRRLFEREASVLKRLSGQHSQIPRLYEYFTVGEDFYLVREWIDGLTLKQKVEQEGKLSPIEVEQILENILSFLGYIHGFGIVYRQLKPSSIILRRDRPKGLAESFGLAPQPHRAPCTQHTNRRSPPQNYLPVPIYFSQVKELAIEPEKPDRRSLVLSHGREYVAPEQKQGKSVYASDLYSLGLTAIYLLTGKNPAKLPRNPLTKQILWHQEVPELKIHLMRTIDRAICFDPQDRFTNAAAMLQALNSPTISLSIPVVDPPAQKNYLTPEIKVISGLFLFGMGVLGIAFVLLNFNFSQLGKEVNDPLAEARIEAIAQKYDSLPTAEPMETWDIPVFILGDSLQQVTKNLGKPSSESKGYWQNSKALLYRDFGDDRVDLGYLADVQTNKIRQTEMSFAQSVDLATIQQAARRLLQDDYSQEIAQYIEKVYLNHSDRQQFQINDLEGVVQRNPQNHIYFALWDSQFH